MRRALESPVTAWIVLALGIVATVMLWRDVAAVEHDRAVDRLESHTRRIQHEIERRMQAYVQLLRGAQGLFAASTDVERSEWAAYVTRLDLRAAYPLLGGIGYLPRVAPDELAAHEGRTRADGLVTYAVRPAGPRAEYFPLAYVAPLDHVSESTLGFDLSTIPARHAAMERARDLGVPSTTGPLEPLGRGAGSGSVIAIFAPIYRHGAASENIAERRAALTGFVTGGFRIDVFLRGVVANDQQVHVRLYDGASFERLLSDSAPQLKDDARGDMTRAATFEVPGRTWTLRVDADSSRLESDSRATGTLIIGLLVALLLFILVGGQVRLKRQASLLARRTTAELERSRDELAASLAEKEVLLAEVHHRVKNNLQVISSLIQMQARRVGDQAAAAALSECRGRVNAIALIHEKLYEEKDVSKLGFGSYVRSLVDGIVRAAHVPTQLIRLDVAVPDVPVPVERAIPCGLLLNELVTNALEHAFPDGRTGTLRVELREETGGQVVLGVSDDGIGLPAGLEPAQSPSLGLRLVAALSSQLKAKLRVERRTSGGTKFEVVLAAAN